MILSPYHNPPYKTPTSKAPSTPPPDSTPKRKRSHASAMESESASLQINPPDQADQSNVTGSLSPRTKVAEKLKDLDIRQVRSIPQRSNEQLVRRKRLKRNRGVVDDSSSSDSMFGESAHQHGTYAASSEGTDIDEVGESPGHNSRLQITPSLGNHLEDFKTESEGYSTDEDEIIVTAQPKQPPGNQMLSSIPPNSKEITDRSVSPLPLREELTPDQAALTWQDDEITGHEIDPSGDDDGEGINGIGFKPTPAIAFARQQKRKQQMNEWKAREAREARQKRFNRRRGTASGGTAPEQHTPDTPAGRIVRFAGVG